MEIIEIDGVRLKFVKLTVDQEDQFTDETRSDFLTGAQADANALGMTPAEKSAYLAEMSVRVGAGKCGLVTELGMSVAITPKGMMRILRLASRQHHPHPGIDDKTLYRLITEQTADVARIIKAVLPMGEARDPKATVGPTAGPP